MTPQVVLSAKARADLQAIEDYIAEQSGPMRADMVLSRIEETMRVLAFMPGMGRIRYDLADNARTFSTAPWVIVYVPLADLDGVRILRVVDGRRDLPAVLGTI
jgi:toxin ParE1/3/4